mmetsp:Transcript_46155/g.86088  ORF Transcript_46155/g.86088 Transcript_46155/m.86088 type:complete len:206 (-) Transcript_46155:68-685(-)
MIIGHNKHALACGVVDDLGKGALEDVLAQLSVDLLLGALKVGKETNEGNLGVPAVLQHIFKKGPCIFHPRVGDHDRHLLWLLLVQLQCQPHFRALRCRFHKCGNKIVDCRIFVPIWVRLTEVKKLLHLVVPDAPVLGRDPSAIGPSLRSRTAFFGSLEGPKTLSRNGPLPCTAKKGCGGIFLSHQRVQGVGTSLRRRFQTPNFWV